MGMLLGPVTNRGTMSNCGVVGRLMDGALWGDEWTEHSPSR